MSESIQGITSPNLGHDSNPGLGGCLGCVVLLSLHVSMKTHWGFFLLLVKTQPTPAMILI